MQVDTIGKAATAEACNVKLWCSSVYNYCIVTGWESGPRCTLCDPRTMPLLLLAWCPHQSHFLKKSPGVRGKDPEAENLLAFEYNKDRKLALCSMICTLACHAANMTHPVPSLSLPLPVKKPEVHHSEEQSLAKVAMPLETWQNSKQYRWWLVAGYARTLGSVQCDDLRRWPVHARSVFDNHQFCVPMSAHK